MTVIDQIQVLIKPFIGRVTQQWASKSANDCFYSTEHVLILHPSTSISTPGSTVDGVEQTAIECW